MKLCTCLRLWTIDKLKCTQPDFNTNTMSMSMYIACYPNTSGAIPLKGNSYGSRDPDHLIAIADVYCSGSQDSLLDCSFDEIILHEFCDHTTDVGVICQGISQVAVTRKVPTTCSWSRVSYSNIHPLFTTVTMFSSWPVNSIVCIRIIVVL